MGKPSFWERLGRGVGYGWHKAKELGEQLGDQVEGKLEKERLEMTFKALIRRHETLRTSFYLLDNEAVQRIHKEVEFEIEPYEPVDSRDEPLYSPEVSFHHSSLITHHCTRFIRPFDLKGATAASAVGNIEQR